MELAYLIVLTGLESVKQSYLLNTSSNGKIKLFVFFSFVVLTGCFFQLYIEFIVYLITND